MNESQKKDIENIKHYLEEEIGAQAIILCGSRSVGDYKKHSDWDLKVLLESSQIKWIFPNLKGYELDITQHSFDTHFSFEEFGLKLRFCEIITDNKNNDAHRIIKEAHEFYEKGPEPWSRGYALTRQEKVRRYESKFKDCIASKNWFELHQRLNWHFLENSYTWWYGLRSEWRPRPQNIISGLKERDPVFAKILCEIVHPATSDLEKVNLFKQLHESFFKSEEYLLKIREKL